MPKLIPLVKRCIECGVEKPVSEFWRHHKSADGLFHRCATCCDPRSGPNATVKDESGEGFKFCPKCKQTLPKTEFGRHYTHGTQSICKQCTHSYDPNEKERKCRSCKRVLAFPENFHHCRNGYQHNCKQCAIDQGRESKLRRLFNLTVEQYDAMVAAQNGLCFLCGRPERRKVWKKQPRLAVDHCHTCGTVRKLLCMECNRGIAFFDENPDLLRKAADYVERHRAECVNPSDPFGSVT